MEKEQKPRRPRIGENKGFGSRDGSNERYEKVNYNRRDDYDHSFGNRRSGDYRQPGRYNNRYNNGQGYNRNYNGDGENSYRSYNRTTEEGERNFNTTENSVGYNSNRYNNYNRNYNRQDNAEGYNRYNTRRPFHRSDNGEGEPNYNSTEPRAYGENRPYRQNNNRIGFNNRKPYGMQQRRQQRPVMPKRIEYDESSIDPNEPIRLNKYLANAGVCSRREADEFIEKGEIKVNGNVVTELGTKITRNDVVTHNDKVVVLEHKIYVLLNKPKDCVTTVDDPQGRLTVMDIVRNACPERIYPVGRLDRNTTGVLLLTNDGDLASKLTHPKFIKKKIYHVWLDRDIPEDDLQRIADGIELDDGPIHADAISYANETDKNQVGIEIHSGRNRVVRRIFEHMGYRVVKLDRVYFAGLTKKNLPRGRWRYLTQQEVNFLKMGSFE